MPPYKRPHKQGSDWAHLKDHLGIKEIQEMGPQKRKIRHLFFLKEVIFSVSLVLLINDPNLFISFPRSYMGAFTGYLKPLFHRIYPLLIFRSRPALEKKPSCLKMDVTSSNFGSVLPQIYESIDAATFVAIDAEFTGLPPYGMLKFYDTIGKLFQLCVLQFCL